MEAVTKNLGWALAHLQFQGEVHTSEQTEADNDYVIHVKKRFTELNNNGHLPLILEKLPDHTCSINQPFLENNEDFFIALFSNTKHDEACIRLYKHMNDCYPCFEIFSQVLRDYYRQGESLKDLYGETHHG